MSAENKVITLLVPCYNEEKMLPIFYKELIAVINPLNHYNWEILLINDGSKDNTLGIFELLQQADNRVNYINLSRNFGKEAAMLAGFDYCQGDALVIMDADLQDPPSLIPEMLKYWEEGYDDVYAKRKSRGKESWLRKKLSLAFYQLLQKMTKIDILQNVGDFRLLDRKCIETLKELRENERYTKGLFCWIGYKKKELLFDRGDSKRGKSTWNILKLINLALEGITSFTTAPLRIASFLGFIVSTYAFIYMCWVWIRVLIWGDPVAGYPSLVMIILFLGGVQLLSLGIIGEYLGRIFHETKNRPTYIIEKYKQGKDCPTKN